MSFPLLIALNVLHHSVFLSITYKVQHNTRLWHASFHPSLTWLWVKCLIHAKRKGVFQNVATFSFILRLSHIFSWIISLYHPCLYTQPSSSQTSGCHLGLPFSHCPWSLPRFLPMFPQHLSSHLGGWHLRKPTPTVEVDTIHRLCGQRESVGQTTIVYTIWTLSLKSKEGEMRGE